MKPYLDAEACGKLRAPARFGKAIKSRCYIEELMRFRLSKLRARGLLKHESDRGEYSANAHPTEVILMQKRICLSVCLSVRRGAAD